MSVDGTWNIVVKSPIGDQKSTLSLTADGATLTGTASGQGSTIPIANGKVDGDAVSWSSTVTAPFPMTLDFTGKVDGDTLNGSVKAGSFGNFPFTGVRG